MTQIWFYGNYGDANHPGLIGSIPTEIYAAMPKLNTLFIHNCDSLEGTLPTELGLATSLQRIYFGDTEIRGTIPTEIGLLTNLLDLNGVTSHITGTIPTEIGQMAALKNISLSRVDLTGPIPSEIGLLKQLTDIYFGTLKVTKKYSGAIPSEIGTMSSLKMLALVCNTFLLMLDNGCTLWPSTHSVFFCVFFCYYYSLK